MPHESFLSEKRPGPKKGWKNIYIKAFHQFRREYLEVGRFGEDNQTAMANVKAIWKTLSEQEKQGYLERYEQRTIKAR